MSIEIEQYALAWHPTDGGAYRIVTKGSGGVWRPWVRVSSADLAAIGVILQHKPAYVSPTGHIATGPEQVGGD